eukprot:g8623.t1
MSVGCQVFANVRRRFPSLSFPQDDQRELDLKCWAVILGHITGFASINAWTQLQAYCGGSVLILPLAFFSLWGLFKVTERLGVQLGELGRLLQDIVREWVALVDDGVKDKMEEAWDEATEEWLSENA